MSQPENSLAGFQSPGVTGIFDGIFLAHPREAGEAYGEHLLFTLRVAGYLTATAACLAIHGLLPCFHQTTTSRRVAALNNLFRVRARQYKTVVH